MISSQQANENCAAARARNTIVRRARARLTPPISVSAETSQNEQES